MRSGALAMVLYQVPPHFLQPPCFFPNKIGTSVEFDKDVGMMSTSGHTIEPNIPQKGNPSDSAGGSGFEDI